MAFAEGTPTATITLGGKPYTLGFTLGAMKRAQTLGVLEVNASDETAMMLALPEYVWACMEEADRASLSVAAISELMNPYNMKEIAEAVGELFHASMPKEDTSGNGQPAAVKAPTAGTSTSNSSGQLASSISG